MFTGLVQALGTVEGVSDQNGIRRLKVSGELKAEELPNGASVSHSGVCLTVVGADFSGTKPMWEVEAVPETLSLTTLGEWSVGRRINLEPSLRLGDELGGHLVFGHVDGLGEIVSITPEGDSFRVRVAPPAELKPFFAKKGSVSVDGISLTVANTMDNGDFELAIIPHTWNVTSLGTAKVGDKVHLEVDMLARYVARQLDFRT